MRHILLAALILISAQSIAAEPKSNEALMELKKQDQAARSTSTGTIDWKKVSGEDAERRSKVAEMLRAGEVKTAVDFFNAALIYQHGGTVGDIRMAYSLANVSAMLDPHNVSAKWLTAAAWDRIMLRLNKPQWYGTQFTKTDPAGKFELYKIDESAVTDEDRVAMGVPTLAESKIKATKLK